MGALWIYKDIAELLIFRMAGRGGEGGKEVWQCIAIATSYFRLAILHGLMHYINADKP